MKRIGLYIGCLAFGSLNCLMASAQTKTWELDSCMAYAVEHATDVKREVVNARQRKQDYQKAVTDFLPSVAGGVQGQYAWGRNIDPETNTSSNPQPIGFREILLVKRQKFILLYIFLA